MGEAMDQVRVALGDDAMIVSTTTEDGGVRITVALEGDDEAEDAAADPYGAARGDNPRNGDGYGDGGDDAMFDDRPFLPHGAPDDIPDDPLENADFEAFSPEEEEAFDAVYPEHRLVEPVTPDGAAAAVAEMLYGHGAPAPVCEALIAAVADLDTDDPLFALGMALDAVFAFHPLPEGRNARPLALVGPPGGGKTLTVAKLAARAVFRGRPVTVITTDTVRAGSLEQLTAFTRLLKVRLVAADDPAALAAALDAQRAGEPMIIDTASRNPFDPTDRAELAEFLAAGDLEPVLVLSAGLDALEAAEIAAAFRDLGVGRMLPTRLDMTRRLGSVLSSAFVAHQSLCDAGVAPRVAEGLTPLNPVSLARILMPGTSP